TQRECYKKGQENIKESIQESIQETSSNSDFAKDVPDSALVDAPKIIVGNCKNCNIDINFSFNK
ncbi:46276_t:CDS:1, partial [Gigaspora margarita]